MPGYGFAFAAADRVEAWNRLMDKYLTAGAYTRITFQLNLSCF